MKTLEILEIFSGWNRPTLRFVAIIAEVNSATRRPGNDVNGSNDGCRASRQKNYEQKRYAHSPPFPSIAR